MNYFTEPIILLCMIILMGFYIIINKYINNIINTLKKYKIEKNKDKLEKDKIEIDGNFIIINNEKRYITWNIILDIAKNTKKYTLELFKPAFNNYKGKRHKRYRGYQALLMSVRYSNSYSTNDAVIFLLDQGINPNYSSKALWYEGKYYGQMNHIINSAYYCYLLDQSSIQTFETLLKYKANPNSYLDKDTTILMRSYYDYLINKDKDKNLKIIKLLLKYGADIHCGEEVHISAYILACSSGQLINLFETYNYRVNRLKRNIIKKIMNENIGVPNYYPKLLMRI